MPTSEAENDQYTVIVSADFLPGGSKYTERPPVQGDEFPTMTVSPPAAPAPVSTHAPAQAPVASPPPVPPPPKRPRRG